MTRNEWTAAAAQRYLSLYPEEAKNLDPLMAALKRKDDLGSRSTFPLHLTGGAVVIDDSGEYVLLVLSRKFNFWLQPGGHLDPGELPQDAATRELREECGPVPAILMADVHPNGLPFDIDIHRIPENSRKREPEHFHCDFRYLYRSARVKPEPSEENREARWVRFGAEVERYTQGRLRKLLNKALVTATHSRA